MKVVANVGKSRHKGRLLVDGQSVPGVSSISVGYPDSGLPIVTVEIIGLPKFIEITNHDDEIDPDDVSRIRMPRFTAAEITDIAAGLRRYQADGGTLEPRHEPRTPPPMPRKK